ncbi:MAG: murein L,D-transpeptidase, partial [Maritimibacter sp.]|nr:murein L,D-transpeptidase [Maritimibacter sp.]
MTPVSRLKTRLLSTIAAVALCAAPLAAGAQTQSSLGFSAFAQAVAEAALPLDEVAAFYRETGYTPVWTGQTA